MIIDLNYVFKNLDGSKIVNPDTKELDKEGKEKVIPGKPVTLKSLCEMALTLPVPGEEDLAVEKKLQRGDLAMRIYKEKGKVDLSAKEVVLLMDLLGKGGGPLIVVQAFEVLDPKNKPPKEKRSNLPGKKNK